MLLRFSIENWMSFRASATLSMLASREKQHAERLAQLAQHQKLKLLPVAAIYGANASGKSNLVRAMAMARSFVVLGNAIDHPIPRARFRLDDECIAKPTRFTFEILAPEDDQLYEFSFAVTGESVVEERLTRIGATTEQVLYDRKENDPDPRFHRSLKKTDRLRFAFEGTRKNQLFLTNSVSQSIQTFAPVYRWFQNTLVLFAPESRFEPFERFWDDQNPLTMVMNERLSQLDTGISRLGGEEVPIEMASPDFEAQSLQKIKEGTTLRLRVPYTRDMVAITMRDGKLTAKKLFTLHQNSSGQEIRFELSQESDGTLRLLDLIPVFQLLSPSEPPRVIIIDELDRSLHSLLTRNLLETFLATAGAESHSQLIFTTHDVMLMDQNLLRRDEMWVAERDAGGASQLWSFSEYADVRKDKDIRKSYLQGRMGGIPRILTHGSRVSSSSGER